MKIIIYLSSLETKESVELLYVVAIRKFHGIVCLFLAQHWKASNSNNVSHTKRIISPQFLFIIIYFSAYRYRACIYPSLMHPSHNFMFVLCVSSARCHFYYGNDGMENISHNFIIFRVLTFHIIIIIVVLVTFFGTTPLLVTNVFLVILGVLCPYHFCVIILFVKNQKDSLKGLLRPHFRFL